MKSTDTTQNTYDEESEILRRSLGWRPSSHARVTAAVRGFTMREVLLAVEDPEETWAQDYYAPGRQMRCRGDVAVVVHVLSRVIVTVLWNNANRWTDDQAAARQVAS